MRAVLALGLLIILCGAANAATVHHLRTRQHVIVGPAEVVTAPHHYVYPGYGPIPLGENRNLDPSNRGSG